MIYFKLFFSFLWIGLFSVGGGYAAMPLIQSQAVEINSWLSMEEFANLVTIAEMTPGPILVNAATFVGMRVVGISGAIVATLGAIVPSLGIVSLLAFIYYKYKNLRTFQKVLGCLRPAIVALIASAGLMVLKQVVFSGASMQADNIQVTGCVLFAAALLSMRKFKANPIVVMLLCGVVSLAAGVFFS